MDREVRLSQGTLDSCPSRQAFSVLGYKLDIWQDADSEPLNHALIVARKNSTAVPRVQDLPEPVLDSICDHEKWLLGL
jgi:hypothetical protein